MKMTQLEAKVKTELQGRETKIQQIQFSSQNSFQNNPIVDQKKQNIQNQLNMIEQMKHKIASVKNQSAFIKKTMNQPNKNLNQ